MRTVLFLGALMLATAAATGGAKAQGWCLVDDTGRTNCAFATQQQCLASLRGVGGYCQENKDFYTSKEPRWKQNRRRNTEGGVPETPR